VARIRSLISSAALLVKVSTAISRSGTPQTACSYSALAMRTVVFPLPTAAFTRTARLSSSTARRCCSFSL
jgi:hypothetical protein